MDADLRWALSTPWVAARLGLDPLRVVLDALLEGGEERVLAAVRLAAAA